MQNLRPYQIAAVRAAEQAFAEGSRRALIVSATGTGKTSQFAELAYRHLASGGRRALFLAHRRELLNQAAARFTEFGITIKRGLDIYHECVAHVASTQALARRLDTISPDAFDLIIHDEAHHACSPSALRVLNHFPHARICGATATPDRADGASLGLAFDRCVSRYEIDQAVAEGYLVPVRALRVEVEGLDLSAVRLRMHSSADHHQGWRDVQDLHPGQLSKAAVAPEAVEGVVSPLMELAGSMKTVVFAVDRRHAAALVTSLNARKTGCARSVDGSMRKADRDAVLAAFSVGAFQFLVNVVLLTEGWDCPFVECVALARPTTSRVFVAQAVGRGLRLSPGKSVCTVIDFTTASSQFSLVGPEDVLGGAMIAPTVKVRVEYEAPKPMPVAAYVPPTVPAPPSATAPHTPVHVRPRFTARLVNMMGTAARSAWKWFKG